MVRGARIGRSFEACLTALALLSCVTTGEPISLGEGGSWRQEITLGPSRIILVAAAEDEEAASKVVGTLADALPAATVWGDLLEPVTIRLFSSHEALASATGRHGYRWLRAWARYDEVLLQSPFTFEPSERGRTSLTELMAHELTHCLMYQMSSPRDSWQAKDRTIPIWFREGMASYTAGQGHRRLSEARLAEWRKRSGLDPVASSPEIYRDNPEVPYSAAHWAFAFLVERYGAQAVVDIMGAMKRSLSFSDAFELVVGISERRFTDEYVRYLDWGGWIERRRPRPREVLQQIDSKRADRP